MDIQELNSRYESIQNDIDQAKDLKSRLEERKKNAKKQLEQIVAKVKAQGYEPSKLREIRDKKMEELEELVTKKDKEVKEVLSKLKDIDLETSV